MLSSTVFIIFANSRCALENVKSEQEDETSVKLLTLT